jgi:tetratricopeptide (TPR) repeat protein
LNFAQGNLQVALGNKRGAKSFFFAALLLDPKHVGAFNNIGLLALEEEKWEMAARCFRHALEQTPNDPKLHYLLARSELKNGKLLVAEEEIARALRGDARRSEYLQLKRQICAAVASDGGR